MKDEDKIKLLGIKLYIQLILLDKNILSKIKIKFDEKKINFLYNNYKKFFYQISEHFIYISKDNEKNNYKINFCNKNINPCKSDSKKKNNYEIVILFNYNNKKINIPITLFQFDCNKKNYSILEKYVKNIETLLMKDVYLKQNINNILILEKK